MTFDPDALTAPAPLRFDANEDAPDGCSCLWRFRDWGWTLAEFDDDCVAHRVPSVDGERGDTVAGETTSG